MKSNYLFKTAMLIFIILILGVSFIAWFTKTPEKIAFSSATLISNSAAGDTSVETLKTLTAELANVQDQNQQLIKQNLALKEKEKIALQDFKNNLMNEVHQAVTEVQMSNQATETKMKESLHSMQTQFANQEKEKTIYPIDRGNKSDAGSLYTWVDDMAGNQAPVAPLASHSNGSLLHPMKTILSSSKKKPLIPYITIPENATLTGAVAMQPLVGRVPIDGRVRDPYTFKVALGVKNLAASNIYIPEDVQGVVASGIATGDMLGECVRGTITSLTFVFQDGRISTADAKENRSLGTISAANGNPCIRGEFHTNAAIALGGTIAIAGAQGYANALSQAQFQNTVVNGSILSTLKNANTYALGQAGSEAASSAQRWWQQRVQNSFDFVYVPNIDPKTGQLLKLVLNITQEIHIDYNPQGRKVYYGNHFKPYLASYLD